MSGAFRERQLIRRVTETPAIEAAPVPSTTATVAEDRRVIGRELQRAEEAGVQLEVAIEQLDALSPTSPLAEAIERLRVAQRTIADAIAILYVPVQTVLVRDDGAKS